jgi:NADH:ubiquinone oxidoreductase subunit 4 (subunit M)
VSIAIPIVIMVVLTVMLGVYPELGLKIVDPVVNFMMTSLGGS